ncbi:MAG: prenyltransferase/squalene oxidase repeat-containing protein, partial [Planctomycetaceae bacterium]
MKARWLGISTVVVLSTATLAGAGQPDDVPSPEAVRRSVERGLVIVQTAARNYPSHRQCFSCHHQTLPMFAMTAARDAGIEMDAELLGEQMEFTQNALLPRRERLEQGESIGGRAATATYALWTYGIAGEEPDDLSRALIAYLLKTQNEDGSWRPPSNRPPMEKSPLTTTTLALYGLERYAVEEQQTDVADATQQAREWIASAAADSHEDRVMRLWALHEMGTDEETINTARQALLESQKDDGGWPQLAEMTSDAYATGQALWVLRTTGTPPTEPAILRGVAYLLKTQEED